MPTAGPVTIRGQDADLSQLAHFLHQGKQARSQHAIIIRDEYMFIHYLRFEPLDWFDKYRRRFCAVSTPKMMVMLIRVTVKKIVSIETSNPYPLEMVTSYF